MEAVRNTNLISIAYRHKDPQRAATVVNTLARVFIEQNQRLNQEDITSTKQFIETQLAAQQKTLAEAEKKVLDFKRSHELFSLDHEAEGLVNTQVQLEASRMQIETELKGALAQQADLTAKIAAAGAVTDRFYSYWTTTLEQVKGQITILMAQQGNIDRQIAQIKRDIGQLPPQESELARLLGNERIANEIHTTLLSKYEEVRVNEAAKIASIRLIEPAVVADTPVFPKKRQYLLLAAAAGLLLGFSLAFVLDYFDDSIRSLEELKAILPYDILGYIPYQESESMLYHQHGSAITDKRSVPAGTSQPEVQTHGQGQVVHYHGHERHAGRGQVHSCRKPGSRLCHRRHDEQPSSISTCGDRPST